MTADPLACPYCNAQITLAPGTAAGQRVPCPRCGESFTPNRPPAHGSPAVTLTPLAPALDLIARPPRSNRAVAAVVVGVMACMAAGGLAFALMTQKVRRAHDTDLSYRHRRHPLPTEPAEPAPAAPAPVPPARLAALGYLAPGTNLIAAAHVAELLASDSGRELLNAPLRLGPLEFRPSTLEQWTGIPLANVEHAVVGVRAEDIVPPWLNLVVHTRAPYDREKVLAALHAKHFHGRSKKELYQFEVRNLTLLLWFADDRTLVVGLASGQLDALPATPRPGLEQLPEELQGLLKDRVGPGGQLWAAGHSRDWNKTVAAALFQRLQPEDARRLRELRGFAVWLQADGQIVANGAFECASPAAARRLDDYAHTLLRANPTLKTAREGPWLTAQVKTNVQAVRGVLGR